MPRSCSSTPTGSRTCRRPEGAHLAPLPGGAGGPGHLLRPALPRTTSRCATSSRRWSRTARHAMPATLAESALHQAVLAEQRAATTTSPPASSCCSLSRRAGRGRGARPRAGAAVPPAAGETLDGAARPARALPLRRVGRSDGHAQDARRRAATSCWQRQQPLRRRHGGGSRRLRGALPAQLAAGEADGMLVEEVYRVERPLRRRVARIMRPSRGGDPVGDAVVAPRPWARSIQWYRTGEDADRKAFDIAWVKDQDSPVDTMNGFIEVYMDAARHQGRVGRRWSSTSTARRPRDPRLAAQAQWFEDRMPMRSGYRKPEVQGVTATRHRRGVETGDSGPSPRSASTCPTTRRCARCTAASRCRCRTSSRPTSAVTLRRAASEFSWDAEEFDARQAWSAFAGELTTEHPRGHRPRLRAHGRGRSRHSRRSC